MNHDGSARAFSSRAHSLGTRLATSSSISSSHTTSSIGTVSLDTLASSTHSLNSPMISNRFKEGEEINTDVTSPGALIALALCYLNSNNSSVASIPTPSSSLLYLTLRSDLLLLRVVCHNLIMLKRVEPSEDFLNSLMSLCAVSQVSVPLRLTGSEANKRVCVCVVAGACFSLALKFAGTHDTKARDFVIFHLKLLLDYQDPCAFEFCAFSRLS